MPNVKRPTARQGFIRLLWTAPLWSILATLFFGTIYGHGLASYFVVYRVSLVFSYLVGLSTWGFEHFALRRLEATRPLPIPAQVASFVLVAVLASLAAAVVVHFTVLRGFLDSARTVLIIGMFALLFAVLGVGIIYSLIFYRESLRRAKDEQELDMARRIQRSFLIESFPLRPQLEIHAVNRSSRQVSGDFYDVVPVGDDGVLIAVADVSGKGVPAALLSSMLQASVRTQAGDEPSIAAMMTRINSLVCQRTSTGQFATFFLGWIDERTLRLRYTNAGHNQPLHLSNGTRRLLDVGGTVVGMMETLSWEEAEIALAPGDRLLLYTDGVTEAMNAAGEMYGEDRLYALADSLPVGLTASAMVEGVLAGLGDFLSGAEPGDDVTIMALRVLDVP